MDVLGPRLFHDGPVLSPQRRLPGRFQLSKLNDRGPRSTCELCCLTSRTNPVNRIEELLPWKLDANGEFRRCAHWSGLERYGWLHFPHFSPGLPNLPIRCLPDLTPAVWVARHS